MENPYYQIIALMRQQGQSSIDSSFIIRMIGYDREAQTPVFAVEGQRMEGDFLAVDGVSAGVNDVGSSYLCTGIDAGYLLLCKVFSL